jgi:hypothetical protein
MRKDTKRDDKRKVEKVERRNRRKAKHSMRFA